MENIDLPGFKGYAPMPKDQIEKYGHLSPSLVKLWTEFGLGTAVDGYIKLIHPDQWRESLSDVLPDSRLIPIAVTGLGDVLVWDTEEMVACLKFRYGIATGMGDPLPLLGILLREPDYLKSELEWEPYPQATKAQGPLHYNECFGYVPLLALGGPESADHLQKVDAVTHIQLIHQLAGPIAW